MPSECMVARLRERVKKMSTLLQAMEKSKGSQPAKKSRDKATVVQVPELAQDLAEFLQNKELAETYTSAYKQSEQRMINWALKWQSEQNDLIKSVKLSDGEHTIRVVTSDAFSVKSADVEPLKEILGDKYPVMIEEETTVKLKSGVLADPEKTERLAAMLGDSFDEFFEVSNSVKTRKGFDAELHKMPADQASRVREFAIQKKPRVW